MSTCVTACVCKRSVCDLHVLHVTAALLQTLSSPLPSPHPFSLSLPLPAESQRKVPLDLVVVEEDTPYDVGPSKDYLRQQELLCE